MIKIESLGGRVLYTAEHAEDVRQAVSEAVGAGTDLRDANLRDANLRGAVLRDADLRGAVLRFADLSFADLRGANLSGTDLSFANLRDANLRVANLSDADLSFANLSFANLRFADLSNTGLSDADLRGTDLRFADLRAADLRFADLRGTDLRGFRRDLWDVLDRAPREAAGMRAALIEGRVDGSVYTGKCSCLVGTIARLRGGHADDGYTLEEVGLRRDASRPAEQWFLPIRPGDRIDSSASPHESEGVFRARLAVQWLDEWRVSRAKIADALSQEREAQS